MTGDTCLIPFIKSGWTNIGYGAVYDISGYVKNKDGKECIKLYGKWNQFLTAKWLVDSQDHKIDDEVVLWTCPENHYLGGEYNFTRFAATLNDMEENYKKVLPPTDSRLRPDRICLEKEEFDKAFSYKNIIENKQRKDREDRKANGEEWSPAWFKSISDSRESDGSLWVYNKKYWEKQNEFIHSGCKPEQLKEFVPELSLKSACNFLQYETI
eukprot:TRINITY_DN4050_c0_g1_i2.p1 TRINITY_DN4050_c0_g1~~TRINITY_DN4050_c0_g1_i2.p1  ORF type:complete len:212 (-),score=42.97 TRINITY_DN4050_c0_g1_i2:45-680(-)